MRGLIFCLYIMNAFATRCVYENTGIDKVSIRYVLISSVLGPVFLPINMCILKSKNII